MGTALAREQVDDPAGWTSTDHLLAHVLDALRAANWQRGGKDAGPFPKPWPRPGMKPEKPTDDYIAQARERMAWRLAREEE